MIAEEVAAARERYRRDGFFLCPEPLIPAETLGQAVAGMDRVRAGEYDTGRPPRPSSWSPGDDPNALCKIEMPQIASHAIMQLVSHPALGAKAAEITAARRTENSRPNDDARDGLTSFIDDPSYCPVIFGDASLLMR